MDYKSVLEEQIRELQKKQDEAMKRDNGEINCMIAKTIIELVNAAKYIGK